jgi:probable F420-dependent oxidoreductase
MEMPRFNVVLPTQSFAETREFATRAEAVGYDAVAVEDHFFMRSPMAQPEDARLECFTVLTAVAMLTRRVKLAQLVACNSYRHPAMTAKIAASLDHVSGGRLELGLGAGWFREEYDALGIPYPPPKVRIAEMREALQIIKKLWSEPVVSYDGAHYKIRNAYAEPKPLSKPRPKILLGGSGPALLRVAGEEADILNLIPPTGGKYGKLLIDEAMKFDVVEYQRRATYAREHARAVGRDPEDLELSQFLFVTLGADPASADAMLEAMAQMMGLRDAERARHSPNVLCGDAVQCRDEIRRRRSELGVSYFFLRFTDLAAMQAFGEQVIAKL